MNQFRIWILLIVICAGAAQYWNEQNMREEEFFNARLRERPRRHVANNGAGRVRNCLYAFAGGVLVEIIISKLETMKNVKQHKKEMKALHKENLREQETLQIQKLNDYVHVIGRLDELKLEWERLVQAAKDGGLVDVQREQDYIEFKAPDTNNDEKISRKEFDAYIKEYMRLYPGVSRTDMPRFEDFDVDKNGYVSFAEWQAYLDRQQQQNQA